MANPLGYYTALEQHPVYSMPIGPNQQSTVDQRRTQKNGTCFYTVIKEVTDWLTTNDCHWDFTRGILMIKGQEVSLLERPRRPIVRRVYVEENVFVPPLTQVTVPIRLAWTNYEKGASATELMLDTKQLYQGVVVAQSLLPEVGTKTFLRAVNLSDQPRTLSVGMCMGSAEPVQAVGGVTPAADPAAVLGDLSCQSGGTPAPPLM